MCLSSDKKGLSLSLYDKREGPFTIHPSQAAIGLHILNPRNSSDASSDSGMVSFDFASHSRVGQMDEKRVVSRPSFMLLANLFGLYGVIPYCDKMEYLLSGVILCFVGLLVLR